MHLQINKKTILIVIGIIIILVGAYLLVHNKKSSTAPKASITEKTPPVLVSAVILKDRTTTGVTITWKTNVPATSQVFYGTEPAGSVPVAPSSETTKAPATADSSTTQTTPAVEDIPSTTPESELIQVNEAKLYPHSTTLDTGLVTVHSAVLTDLKPKTKIYYQIVSLDEKGKQSSIPERSFITLTAPAVTIKKPVAVKKPVSTTTTSASALTISNISVKNITSAGATISWTTNVTATSQVVYGTVKSTIENYPSSSVIDSTLSTTHAVQLTGLTANKKIYYRVVSVDKNGKKVVSKEGSFSVTTISFIGVPEKSFKAGSGGVVTVSIYWKTNVATTGQIIYGNTSSTTGVYDNQTPIDTTPADTAHTTSITNILLPYTTYYYRIIAVDTAGTKAISDEYSFTTPLESGVSESNLSSTSTAISWNTVEASTGKIKYGTISGTYPFESTTDYASGTSHSITLTGLPTNTKIYFKIISTVGTSTITSSEYTFTTSSQ